MALHLGALLTDAGERGEPVSLDPASLTTHGVIVGMTGSGKTGLGVVLLEECARAGIGALVIDPKGDLTNLALRFPDLAPEDFAPWVDPAEAQRAGQDPAGYAATVAGRWRDGLAGWGLGGEDVRALQQAADVTVYTPGSTAGVPLSILGSLDPPPLSWDTDAEALREEIAGFVDGLLTLAGIDADPLASPEHVLLATIVETAWRAGHPIDVAGLVGQIITPPVRKLGVFDVDAFFPPEARRKLALTLNGLLASPSAAAWLDGAPIDVAGMLRTPDGRPRCAVVTIAHLTDAERQMVVALLLGKVVTWMRGLPGTAELRALVYLDEVAGFCPPTAVPPAKPPILTIMKQARAFGVGMVLATQNPVDLDYKAIGNAGTWMVGRLQTERDRGRLLDGMSSAAGDVDLGALGAAIGALGKREFLLHRTGAGAPVRMTSRWAMSYLRGPLTRAELGALPNTAEVAGGSAAASASADPGAAGRPPVSPAMTGTAPHPVAVAGEDTTPVAPAVPDTVRVTYLDPAAPWAAEVGAVPGGTRLEAALAFRITLRYADARAGIDHTEEWEAVLHPLTAHVDPRSALVVDYDDRDLRPDAPAGASYALPDAPLDRATWYRDLEKALLAEVRTEQALELQRSTALKLYSRPDEPPEAFAARCEAAAQDRADAEIARLRTTLEARIERKRAQLAEAERREAAAAEDARARRNAELAAGAGALLGVLLGGGRGGTVGRAARSAGGIASRRGTTQRAGQRTEAAAARADLAAEELAALERQLLDEVDAIRATWAARAAELEPVTLRASAANARITDRALVWVATT
jgi:hypothetical protein